jgi:hypothetical protein
VLSITMPFEGERELDLALSLLTVIDVKQIRWHKLKPLFQSGVRYKRESAKTCWLPVNGGCEDWLSILQLYRQGEGDCEDIACARAAELIVRGERARAIAQRSAGVGWHIVVRRADGRIEDPSRILGMGDEQGRRNEVAALRARGLAALRARGASLWHT